jgi:hypothetical protein
MIITARTWRWREIEIGSADVDLASMVAGCRAVMVDDLNSGGGVPTYSYELSK